MSICSLKSDNRNTAVRRPPCVKGAVTAGDWGIVSDGELDNLRILQQALWHPRRELNSQLTLRRTIEHLSSVFTYVQESRYPSGFFRIPSRSVFVQVHRCR